MFEANKEILILDDELITLDPSSDRRISLFQLDLRSMSASDCCRVHRYSPNQDSEYGQRKASHPVVASVLVVDQQVQEAVPSQR